jgi:folate-binding protein YgfZ
VEEKSPAIVDLSSWRKVLVTGSDALDWLEDLVSAGLTEIRQQEARRSLLLTPTGRIRADFHVTPYEDGYLLLQDPVQPRAIDEVLAPYVLSSDVDLEELSDGPTAGRWSSDVLVPVGSTLYGPMDLEQFDEWRTRHGIPRFGIDLDDDSLPQEAGWDRFIDFTKGCFMGQEAMAKIRALGGHPTRVVLALRTKESVRAGDPLLAGGREVGVVTSAADDCVLARVSWDARNSALRTANGVTLSQRD